MRTVAILTPPDRLPGLPAAGRALAWLEKRSMKVRLRTTDARRLRRPELGYAEEALAQGADLVLSLGGDGAMLAASRMAARWGIPVLGLHLGGLGFLTQTSGLSPEEALERTLSGRYEIEHRMMLSAHVARGGKRVQSLLALNDIVVRNGAFSRLVRLTAKVNDRFLAVFPADGVIISTPTGSTAYSLSAGGPIVEPTAEVMLLTPICPHALAARPLVMPASERVEVEVPALAPEEQVMVTADGQVAFCLAGGDAITVRRAPRRVRIVSLGDLSFYERLRGKLGWGGTGPTQ